MAVFVNMASLKSLTDEELRKKLKEYGITTPVTASTRNILIKKLNHALASHKRNSTANAKAARTPNSSRLNTFSSDEDDENDLSGERQGRSSRSSRSSRSRRSSRSTAETSLNHRAPAGASRGRPKDGAHFPEAEAEGLLPRALGDPGGDPRGDPRRSPRTSVARYFPVSARSGISPRAKIHDDYDTGSDSEGADGAEALPPRPPSSPAWRGGRDEDLPDDAFKAACQNHSASPTRPYVPPEGARQRRAGQGFLENGGGFDSSGKCRDGNGTGGLGVRAEGPVTQVTSPGNHHEHTRVANGRHHSEPSADLDPTHCDESTWHYSIPFLLLVLLVVFFGVVGMLYVNMRMPLLPTLCSVPARLYQAMANVPVPFFTFNAPERQAQSLPSVSLPAEASASARTTPPPLPRVAAPSTDNKFPVCSSSLKNDCLTMKEVSSVWPLLGQMEEVLLPALHRHARLYNCGNSAFRYLPLADIQELLQKRDTGEKELLEGIEALGKLAELNRNLGLESVRSPDKTLLGLSLATQPTFILCHITAAIYSVFYLLIALIVACLTAWFAFYCVRYHRQKAEEEKQHIFELVEQILEVLGGIGGGSSGGKDFVAVNHVRDSLIGPRDRRSKKDLWDKAVDFIDRFESRVRREIQAVGGEDCEVWRWASGIPHSPAASPGADGGSGRPPAKVWQGQAFEIPHNLSQVTYTSCLKIRNMFDCDVEFGDNWYLRIQDSILEKCEGIHIVHIAVDRLSREGCVYLKCSSLAEAGRAFRALHGWWYDGNLVTVKFLRDERYHQRFPNARHASCRLRPSNNQRLSLQVPPLQPEPSDHA
ncbi:uncharacterized protein LOC119598593 [Penaeus monodon]|uniref:uncharacterized protein LOC119598593 n=1 Tax=Penaeus monodon TaxID=6687 RepID=UPI0018A79D66|nr:uncharacterized protein LOC119598593 [Penaeus monodon]